MNNVQSRLSKSAQGAFKTMSFAVVLILLALPLTRAFADDYRNDRGRNFYGAVTVEGWRLGGAYRRGGYEIWRWTRGGWRRMPGRGVQLGGNPRNPWVINSQGERYQWTGGGWRRVGYANGRRFNSRRNVRPPVFRNDPGRNNWNNNRGSRNYRNDVRRGNLGNAIEQQRGRIERQQDRIRDLRQDLRQDRRQDRIQERREDRRRDRVQDRRDDRVQNRREDRREDRGGNRDRNEQNDRNGDRNGRRDGDRNGQSSGRRQ